jgi:hypothetical protein
VTGGAFTTEVPESIGEVVVGVPGPKTTAPSGRTVTLVGALEEVPCVVGAEVATGVGDDPLGDPLTGFGVDSMGEPIIGVGDNPVGVPVTGVADDPVGNPVTGFGDEVPVVVLR